MGLGARLDELVPRLLERQPRALGRAISILEDGGAEQRELVRRVFPATGKARVVGVTGPPGAGKSTLVDRLARLCRKRGETVGILAVDPTSPITGGALLGDRIRMQGHVDDSGVYVRSMASRGHLGGLSVAAAPAVAVMARAGLDIVLVETVGVGQSELEIMDHVDVVVLVLAPGWGDQIQADKAGIVEIADVFVVNKGDRPGVDIVHRALVERLGSSGAPILVTTATTGEGVSALVDVIR